MGKPDFDKEQVLSVQKSLLENKRNRLNGIIELINDVREGVNTMNFEAFNEADVEHIISTMQKELSEEQFEEFIKTHGDGSVAVSYTHLVVPVKSRCCPPPVSPLTRTPGSVICRMNWMPILKM